MAEGARIVEGRSCDGCSLCCYLLAVHALEKPINSWCRHCPTRRRCAIYDDRPDECRGFHCGWLTGAMIGDEWDPKRCRMVLAAENDGLRLTAIIHPDRPDAWRRQPYYRQLKAWAEAAILHRGQVVIKNANRYTVVLPDRDVELGEVGPDELIVTAFTPSPHGMVLEPMKLHRDDPRARGLG
jgi:uncharacterized cysteine cluster protein YcgN (CxxCxxCC family)